MATPDSAPSGVPPQPSTPPSQPSTPPSQPSTPPPQPATTPPTSVTPPTVAQPNADPPDPSSPSPPSTPPDAPPPSNSGTPPATPPPSTSPPTVPSVPPPSSPVTPPPSPPIASPPPPTTTPPVGVPPPAEVPPPSSPANPPTSPPSPPGSSTPPPSSSPPPALTPPPTSTPTPPSANPPDNPLPSPTSPSPPADSPPPSAARPPGNSPPPAPTSPPSPPSTQPPESSPPPPSSQPPQSSPPPPSSQPPQSSPSPPGASPPTIRSPPPSRDSPPPSDRPASPPSIIPGPPAPDSQISPPGPGSDTRVPSPPSLPDNRSTPNSPETANSSPSQGGMGTGGAIAIGVIAGLLMLGLLGFVGLWIFKGKRKSSGPYDGHVIPASIGSSPRSDGKLLVTAEYPASSSNFGGGSGSDTPPTDHGGFGHSRSWFTYHELYEATSGFSDEKLLGEGGFGRVYKGLLADGRVVAVKQLKVGGGQGEREFKAEVDIISRIHHRHLVSLVGYCIWETKRLLVYDYVSNDTLHFHLHGKSRPVMEWETRVKIAVGAARGITYLHEDCHPRIIHRDIKSSNILLDSNFEARVSDFGLAKLAMDAETHVSTRVMGTFGYMAPEYAQSGKLTEKSDVFSYGVVLLELITGRKPVDESQPVGDESLVEWARLLLAHAIETGELEGLVDPRLEKNYIESEMFRLIEAAGACVRHSSVKRPKMGMVLRALSMSDSGDLSNGLRVGESQLYDSAQQSADIRWFRRMAFGSQDISTDFFSNPSQNLGYSGQSKQNVHLSTQLDPNRYSQNTGLRNQSANNLNFSAERLAAQHNPHLSTQHDFNPSSQNMGFRNQSGNNLNFSGERLGTQRNPYLSSQHDPNRNFQNLGFRNQSGNNLNFSAERHSSQHNPGTQDTSIHREDSGNI